jgi:CDP-glucose 4,6-dehydratase
MSSGFNGAFENRRVLVTGHTGFKGSWLTLWLNYLGAEVYGYSLPPPTEPSLFDLLNLQSVIAHKTADIRDKDQLTKYVEQVKPDIIFHLAAQTVVRESYAIPHETVDVNVLGTVNVMEAVRANRLRAGMVMVTSDKCYENREWLYGYRESDSIGGFDPYSASKGAADILISAWRNSFFNPKEIKTHGVRLASVRAGNVVGGGDWTSYQLVPDCIRALQEGNTIAVRNPNATRPWQHVLEALGGYLTLGARLLDPHDYTATYCEAFNFGPPVTSNRTVRELVEKVIECWGSGSWESTMAVGPYHEASLLNLSSDKAFHKLRWFPRWDFEKTIAHTVAWYKTMFSAPSLIHEATLDQIKAYQAELEVDERIRELNF